jgi:DNA-binding NtrC family response regulator
MVAWDRDVLGRWGCYSGAADPAGADGAAASGGGRLGEARFEPLPGMVGRSPAMEQLSRLVRRIAALRVPVLLLGESGSGKELVARAVHSASPRAEGPFVALNGATLSLELSGSELFGHRRGAFTGARSDRAGAFRQACGGTLFIDEVAALPLGVQARLLRAVEEGWINPVGSDEPVAVDVRIVAATCEPLEQLIARRAFRSDLYQRLSSCVVRIAPLRERRSDIPALADHLLARSEVGPRRLGLGVAELLQAQPWPGNVRELGNVLVQAGLRSDSGRIEISDVVEALSERVGARRCTARLGPEQARALVGKAGGNVSEAARRACLPRTTFRDLLRAASVEHRRGGPEAAAAGSG